MLADSVEGIYHCDSFSFCHGGTQCASPIYSCVSPLRGFADLTTEKARVLAMPTEYETLQPSVRRADTGAVDIAELPSLIASLRGVYEALARFFAHIDEGRAIQPRYKRAYQGARKQRSPKIALPGPYDELRKTIEAKMKKLSQKRLPGPKKRGVKALAGAKRPPAPFSHAPGENPKTSQETKDQKTKKKAASKRTSRGRK
jgi:hypothetical protein